MTRLDLNLVRAFVAIYEAKSVTKAAQNTSVTQPALSRALAKLRHVYGEPLFVRGADGLSPTILADQLFERFSKALGWIESTLEPMDRFDPARSARRFRLAMSDLGVLSFAHPLLRRCQATAPGIEIDIEKIDERVGEAMAVGRLDAVIGNQPHLASAARSESLFHEHYVCVMAADHPATGPKLTLDEFVAGRHIALSTPTLGNRLIDDALSQQGLSRRIVARLPHFSGLGPLLVQSNLLVVLPSRAARLLNDQGKLKTMELPVALPPFEVRVYWHARHERSAAHRWLISEITTALQSPTADP